MIKKSDNGWAEATVLEGNNIVNSTENETGGKDGEEGSGTRHQYQC